MSTKWHQCRKDGQFIIIANFIGKIYLQQLCKLHLTLCSLSQMKQRSKRIGNSSLKKMNIEFRKGTVSFSDAI